MLVAPSSALRRRILWATVFFGVFVLFDIALLSWLIFRSLSEREVREILFEAQTEAEGLASQIAEHAEREGRDILTAVALESETQTYIDTVLSQREIVTKVEIWDSEGKVIYRAENTVTDSAADPPELEPGELEPQVKTKRLERETSFQNVVKVPVGEVGSFVIGLSQVELDERLQLLRVELVRQAGLIALLTLALFLLAYFFILWLLRRSQQLEEHAREAERMAYVGTLASGLAHEIRSPLNSLNLNMQMLEEEVKGQGTQGSGRRLLAITRSEIGRLECLVTDFLSYARPRTLELEEVAAVELLEHSKQVLQGQAQAQGAQIDVEDLSGGATVTVDRAQIGQLLLNLALNALAATQGTDSPARVKLAVDREDHRVVLEVRDNGAGMSEDEQKRVFDLFYSTRKGGTGLGLAIVERIARAHHGTLDVASRPGEGTRVRLSLPG